MLLFSLAPTVAPQVSLPNDTTYNRGDSVTLLCSVMGGPANTYQWLVNGTNITGETSESYTFNIVSASDGGFYGCTVTNAAASGSATTSVLVAPYFTSQPGDEEGSNGDTVVLMCEAEAFPSPQYQWGRVDSEVIRSELVTNSSVLMFAPLLFGDEGQYYCNASSTGVTIQSDATTLTGKGLC